MALDNTIFPGKVVPTGANAIFCPIFTFGAPQTTENDFLPSNTLQRVNLSALGCLTHSLTSPTSTPSTFELFFLHSASRPNIVSVSAIFWLDCEKFKNSFNHSIEIFIRIVPRISYHLDTVVECHLCHILTYKFVQFPFQMQTHAIYLGLY